MSDTEVNIPLLRKAVEWAEAEAAKPPELCEWEQNWFVLDAVERDRLQSVYSDPDRWPIHYRAMRKAPECGTCFCVAGYATRVGGGNIEDPEAEGTRLLGLSWGQAERLFAGSNSIADVRRIAESIAGERL